jgi:peroxiredoxin
MSAFGGKAGLKWMTPRKTYCRVPASILRNEMPRQVVLPVPGTLVIDRSGHIAYAHVDADYRNRPEPQEIVAVCRSLRRRQ